MPNKLLVSAACLAFLFGCASRPNTDAPPPAGSSSPQAASGSKTAAAPAASGSKAAAPARTDGRKVKSKDGKVDGEIFGTPAAKGKFAKLEIRISRTVADNPTAAPAHP